MSLYIHCIAVAIKQPCLPDEIVEFAALLDECRGGVEFHDPAFIQHDDPIGVDDCVDAVRDGDDCALLEDAAAEGALEEGVCFDVDGGLFC